jgi:hypothetical protein
LEYAPQLAIPTFGGKWEKIFSEMLAKSVAQSKIQREASSVQGSALTTDGHTPACDGDLALRHPTFGNYEPEHVACGFVQGNGAGFGPSVRAFDHFDYLIWLLSDESTWLPETHRAFLKQGMLRWAAWLQYGEKPTNEAFKPIAETGKLSEQMYKSLEAGGWKKFRITRAASADLRNRIQASREFLQLPDSTDKLVQAFLQADCIKQWFDASQRRRRRLRKTSATRKKSNSK